MVIYGLTEPGQRWNIRYIGATTSVTRRYGQHLIRRDPISAGPALTAWLDELEAKEQLPELVILDRPSPGDDWRTLKSFYIESHAQAGYALLNRVLTRRTRWTHLRKRRHFPEPWPPATYTIDLDYTPSS